MIRLLHISDLHRSPDDPIDNKTLIASLNRDFERQVRETPPIGPIDAVIVSGDLIQGVPLGETNFARKLAQQYSVATRFLSELADRYLNCDKSRIVIVPGNHDVDWNVAFQSMRAVPESEQDLNLLKYIGTPSTNYRYCMRTRKLYEIVDIEKYESRFEQYCNFLNSFYRGCNLSWPIKADRPWNLFELPEGALLVGAFNSCNRNDLFHPVGSIQEGAIGEAVLEIQESGKEYDLKLAVWHHSIQGTPEQTDYMDVDRVLELVNHGFRLGLHGHQHKTQVLPQTVRHPTEATMVVVSAGSLCVGAKELPYGERRQYNIIEIDPDFQRVRVHVRQMNQGRAFGPRMVEDFGGMSYVDMALSPEMTPVGTVRNVQGLRRRRTVLEAERALASGKSDEAIRLLWPIRIEAEGHARRVLLQALERAQNWKRLCEILDPPKSIDELVAIVNAYCNLRDFEAAELALDEHSASLGLPEPTITDLRQRISAEKGISS